MFCQSHLTILFEAPFWIGLYERTNDGQYEVCKITFGAEPKDYEVYHFLMEHYADLQFTPPIKTEKIIPAKINPKRLQRKIKLELKDKPIGTKAQQALKLEHEQQKLTAKAKRKAQKEAKKDHQYLLHLAKKKAKHKGR